jgi:hypothetical protein
MDQTLPHAITLTCDYWGSPIGTWQASIEISVTESGTVIWATGDCCGGYHTLIAEITSPFSWREACKALLDSSDGAIFGDFRSWVIVTGANGWMAELLAICWMHDDEVPAGIKKFMLELPETSLDWLSAKLGGSLISDDAIYLMGRYLDVCKEDPCDCWKATCVAHKELSDFQSMIELLGEETPEDDWEAANNSNAAIFQLKHILDMFTPAMETSALWDTLQVATRRVKLEAKIRDFTASAGKLPDESEAKKLWEEVLREP